MTNTPKETSAFFPESREIGSTQYWLDKHCSRIYVSIEPRNPPPRTPLQRTYRSIDPRNPVLRIPSQRGSSGKPTADRAWGSDVRIGVVRIFGAPHMSSVSHMTWKFYVHATRPRAICRGAKPYTSTLVKKNSKDGSRPLKELNRPRKIEAQGASPPVG